MNRLSRVLCMFGLHRIRHHYLGGGCGYTYCSRCKRELY